jgi:hypothetical protein
VDTNSKTTKLRHAWRFASDRGMFSNAFMGYSCGGGTNKIRSSVEVASRRKVV